MVPSIPGDHQPVARAECGCAGNKGQTELGRVLWCLHSAQGSLVVLEDLPHPQISKPEMNYWGQLRQEANGITLKLNKACDCALWDPKYLESKGQENRTLLRDDFLRTPGRDMELLCLE